MPPYGFPYPLINAIFIESDLIFVNLFDTFEINNWHFLYNLKTNEYIDKKKTEM